MINNLLDILLVPSQRIYFGHNLGQDLQGVRVVLSMVLYLRMQQLLMHTDMQPIDLRDLSVFGFV